MVNSVNLLILIGSFAGIWYCAGHVLKDIEKIANRLQRSRFIVAFLLLGLLTSLTEISVAINSTWQQVPHLAAGNLIGGSIVIYLLIIPWLAVVGGGVTLRNTLNSMVLVTALMVTTLPAIVAWTGLISPVFGLILVLAYGILLYLVSRKQDGEEPVKDVRVSSERLGHILVRLAGAGIAIFFISRVLVYASVNLAQNWGIPASLVGMLLLSVGTNIPELTIAVRATASTRKSIAFGNYVGSAAFNTLVFGLLLMANGRFELEKSEFMITAPLLIMSLALFYNFAKSGVTLSRQEGLGLGAVYILFVATQILNLNWQ